VLRLVILALGLAAAALAGSARAAETRYGWSYARLMQEIDRAPLRVNGARYRIDRNLAVCNGLGRVIRADAGRRWQRFTCTQLVIRKGQMVDVTFRVRVVDENTFRLTGARYGP
jgi:hypothetical protein